jgi:hypothetical protein
MALSRWTLALFLLFCFYFPQGVASATAKGQTFDFAVFLNANARKALAASGTRQFRDVFLFRRCNYEHTQTPPYANYSINNLRFGRSLFGF